MSSIGPIPVPDAESLTHALDFLRQQQQEMTQNLMPIILTLQQAAAQQQAAQQQAGTALQQLAAQQLAMKTPLLPGMTTEALQARLNEQLTVITTTLQRQQQAVADTLAKGGVTAGVAGLMIGQALGAAEQVRAEMQQLKSQMDLLSQHQQQETLRLQQMKQQFDQAFNSLSNMLKAHQDAAKAEMQQLKSQMDLLSQHQQQETLRLQQMKQQFDQAFTLLSNMLKAHQDAAKNVIQNMR